MTQDFVGIIAVFMASLILSGIVHHTIIELGLVFVVITPPLIAMILGYRVSEVYKRSMMPSTKRRNLLVAVFTGFGLILIIQLLLGLVLLYIGAIFPT
ncbi:MAG: hypothetical protein ACFFDU_03390 [Candidatus Thorarchaeota archaeon]